MALRDEPDDLFVSQPLGQILHPLLNLANVGLTRHQLGGGCLQHPPAALEQLARGQMGKRGLARTFLTDQTTLGRPSRPSTSSRASTSALTVAVCATGMASSAASQ